jgi:parvulin-like peptidyl-prolyl isomerase
MNFKNIFNNYKGKHMLKQTKWFIHSCIFIFITINTALTTQSFAQQEAIGESNILAQDGELTITYDEAKLMTDDMSASQKQKILSDKSKLESLILEALTLKKMTQKAREEGLDKDPLTQWRIENAKNNILASALTKKHRASISTPSDLNELAKEYYKTHQEEFKIAERINAAHILIRTGKSDTEAEKQEKRTRAEEILSKIKKGEDFSKVAKEYSEDPGTAKSGGTLGFFTPGTMVPTFDSAAFKLTKDKPLSDIIESPFGFHIIKLLERIPSSIKTYPQVKDELLKKQKQQFIADKMRSYKESFDASNKNTTIYVPALEKLIEDLK